MRSRLAGCAWLAESELNLARKSFVDATKESPFDVESWFMLGQIHEQLGDVDRAIGFYRHGVVFERDTHESAIALCRLLVAHRQISPAIKMIEGALRRDRRSCELNVAYAGLLQRLSGRRRRRGDLDGAIEILLTAVSHLKVAIANRPSADLYVWLGSLHERTRNPDLAVDCYQKALDRDPDHLAARARMAAMNVDRGKITEAVQEFELVLKHDPDNVTAHFRYARSKRFADNADTERYVTKLQGLLEKYSDEEHKQIRIHFALAKVLDDIGRYDQAWQHYHAANLLKPIHEPSPSPTQRASQRSFQRVTDERIRQCDPSFFTSRRKWGHESEKPVFIVGMPRSGTTMTEQILSCLPGVTGAGELRDVHRLSCELERESRSRTISHRLDAIGSHDDSPDHYLQRISQQRIATAAENFLGVLDSKDAEAEHVIDKMPTNFIHLGLISLMFPAATIVHCRRDPMDVIASCYSQNLCGLFSHLDLLSDYYRQYRRLMEHWLQVLPTKIVTIDYEQMVNAPEEGTRRLVSGCGFQWDDACLRFHETSRMVRTPSKWQVRQPMYQSSVGKWKRFEKQLAPIAEKLADLRTRYVS
ncbi:MAG: sulfotransferase [Planctomycetota bacterium]